MNICQICKKEHKNKKYCSRACRDIGITGLKRSEETRKKISQSHIGKGNSTKGKPKPWMRGENNPNFGNKSQHNNGGYEKLCEAARKRGQSWNEELRKQHSERMLGSSNWMRGKKHTDEYKENMSKIKKKQYENGEINLGLSQISKQEKEISEYFIERNIQFVQQFQIEGHSFFYDFYLPKHNIIIEFNGDYWHANPEKYEKGTLLNIQNYGPTPVEQIWERDEFKKSIAESCGYKLIYIWENNYKKDGLSIIDKLICELEDGQ